MFAKHWFEDYSVGIDPRRRNAHVNRSISLGICDLRSDAEERTFAKVCRFRAIARLVTGRLPQVFPNSG